MTFSCIKLKKWWLKKADWDEGGKPVNYSRSLRQIILRKNIKWTILKPFFCIIRENVTLRESIRKPQPYSKLYPEPLAGLRRCWKRKLFGFRQNPFSLNKAWNYLAVNLRNLVWHPKPSNGFVLVMYSVFPWNGRTHWFIERGVIGHCHLWGMKITVA